MNQFAVIFSPEGPVYLPEVLTGCSKENNTEYIGICDFCQCCFYLEDIKPYTLNDYTIALYGEIYNYNELRQRLESEKIELITFTPQEAILNAWLIWKEKCLDLLEGVFSFCIFHRRENKLYFARDQLGGKPLYYAIRNHTFYCSSHLSSLLKFPEIKPNLTKEGIMELMLLGPGKVPGSGVYQDVFEVKPGHWGYYGDNGLTIYPYWKLKDEEFRDDFNTCVEKTRDLVEHSIQSQLNAQGIYGSFLSGGLDSSIVTSVAAKHMPGLNTFSLYYTDNEKYFHATEYQPNADNGYIGVMEKHLDVTPHHINLDTEELTQALYKATEARELPGMGDVDSSLLLLCSKTADTASVVLSGECADEIFGGYPWYQNPVLRAYTGFPWSQTTSYRKRFLSREIQRDFDAEEYMNQHYKNTLKEVDILPGTDPEEQKIKQLMYLNLQWFMQTLVLRNERMSSMAGITIRAPFCNRKIVEYLYSVPWNFKNYGGKEKGLLRESFRDLLPYEILDRKKSPFPKTWNPKYKEAVAAILKSELNDPSCPLLAFLRKDALFGLCEDERGIPWYGQLMTTPQTIAYFLQLNYWLKSNHVNLLLK